jgi:hypothetical protein
MSSSGDSRRGRRCACSLPDRTGGTPRTAESVFDVVRALRTMASADAGYAPRLNDDLVDRLFARGLSLTGTARDAFTAATSAAPGTPPPRREIGEVRRSALCRAGRNTLADAQGLRRPLRLSPSQVPHTHTVGRGPYAALSPHRSHGICLSPLGISKHAACKSHDATDERRRSLEQRPRTLQGTNLSSERIRLVPSIASELCARPGLRSPPGAIRDSRCRRTHGVASLVSSFLLIAVQTRHRRRCHRSQSPRAPGDRDTSGCFESVEFAFLRVTLRDSRRERPGHLAQAIACVRAGFRRTARSGGRCVPTTAPRKSALLVQTFQAFRKAGRGLTRSASYPDRRRAYRSRLSPTQFFSG